MNPEITNLIKAFLRETADRADKAKKIADVIRNSGCYRWVGLYDVGSELVSIIAFSGPGAPKYPEFPIAQGLTGSAIREKRTIVVGDVQNDPRYLTAFGSTRSEIIIPILDGKNGRVLGTIDVESEEVNAFSDEDRNSLEACAIAAAPLWVQS
jgi:L-methionine (R)-S-oxide reductase